MARARFVVAGIGLVVLTTLAFPATSRAQGAMAGAIAGVVKDASGAVLPGVSVEASSPALIEKVRTVVTDAEGVYKIVDLRAGTYRVAFSLQGFNTAVRDGIELTSNFTAQVNAELKVGDIAETVQVTSAAPLIDVQNVMLSKVVTQEFVQAIPTSRTFQQLANFIPGAIIRSNMASTSQDVGGTAGEQSAMVQVHGSRPGEMQMKVDGMLVNNINQVAQGGVFVDVGSLQEVAFEVGASTAQNQTGGVQANFILRDGGNRHAFSVFMAGTNHSLENSNITPDLIANRGLNSPNTLDKLWDLNGTYSGPLVKDKVWLVLSGRYCGKNNQVAGIYNNLTPSAYVYTPDVAGGPAVDDNYQQSFTGRITWQINQKNKVSVHYMNTNRDWGHQGLSTALTAPESSTITQNPTDYDISAIWTSPITSKLLFEAGQSLDVADQHGVAQPASIAAGTIGVTELSTQFKYRNLSAGQLYLFTHHEDSRASLSYVTGSHAIKVGFYLQTGAVWSTTYSPPGGPIAITLNHGLPSSITYLATPITIADDLNANLGIFAQDQWTFRKATINAGLRFDYQSESVPAQHLGATEWLPVRDFAAQPNVVGWKDISPRVGLSYDLFGNGKTALKATASRYVAGEGIAIAAAENPAANTSATRSWTDTTGNFNPFLTCDLFNFSAQVTPNGSCGAISNSKFGLGVNPTNYDPAILHGWGNRGYNWEFSTSIQQELRPGLSLTAAYYRRIYLNTYSTVNQAADPGVPGNYTSYCVTAPVDPKLPGGGGYPICGLEDVIPSLNGKVSNIVEMSSKLGNDYEHINSFDLTINLRKHGAMLSGGVSAQKWMFDNCDIIGKANNVATAVDPFNKDFFTVAGPNTTYCHQESPFNPTVKIVGSLPLKWGLQVSGDFQSVPGVPYSASLTYTNAQLQTNSTLNRNLAAGTGGTVAVQLIAPSQYLDDRTNQTDGRLSKTIRWGNGKIQANADVYNIFNRAPVQVPNNTYSATWHNALLILPGRLFKFSATIEF